MAFKEKASQASLQRLVGFFDALVQIDQSQKNIKKSVEAIGQIDAEETPDDRHYKTEH